MKPSKEEMMKSLLNGLDKIEQVEPSPFLYAKIIHKIQERQNGQFVFSRKAIWKTSLAFILLLVLNVVGISMYSNVNNSNSVTEESSPTEEYNLTTDNDYYNY